MSDKLHTTLKVQRGAAGEEPRFDSFDVPFEEGASVLDALVWVRANLDASLAFRYSCFNANACKECMVRVDGKTEYACTARLQTGTVTVEPLAKKRLIRDLVTDIVPPKERLSGLEET
ncbi:MAG: 2Fe-2S iron-sulfur cluster-binding protein [Proteobacteria bacterium]|nr:2Fe-2S iron-sulfur cluster-binding protein [Pseudomonadota bacterium]